MVRVRPHAALDGPELARRMRVRDCDEVWASDHQIPLEAIEVACCVSEFVRTIVIDGEIAAMFGVRAIRPEVGIIWLLTTDTVDRKPCAFWRTMKTELLRLLRVYPALANMVDARYTQAVESLRRVGFTVHPAESYGEDGLPFHFCVIRRSNANCTGASAQGGRVEDGQERQTEEAKGRYLERGARPLRVRRHAQERLEAAT